MLIVEEQVETFECLRELLPNERFVNTFLKVSDRLNDLARNSLDTHRSLSSQRGRGRG